MELQPIQYSELYREYDVPLTDIRKHAWRVLSYTLTLLLLLFVVLGFSVKWSRLLSYQFVLKGTEGEHVFRFVDDTYVNERLVKTGQFVEVGTPLFRVSSPRIVELVNSYNDATYRLELFRRNGSSQYIADINIADLQRAKALEIEANEAERVSHLKRMFEQDLREKEFLLDRARSNYERSVKLLNDGVIAKTEVDDAREQVVIATHALETVKAKYASELSDSTHQTSLSRIDKGTAVQTRAQKEQEMESERRRLTDNLKLAYDKIVQNYGDVSIDNGALTVKAPSAGQISYVRESDSEITAGTVILKLLNANNVMYAEVKIPPEEIGFIKEDDLTILKISTFPHYEWGVLKGRIKTISLSPAEDGNFRCEVEITNAGSLQGRLQLGMAGELSLFTDERSFFAYLFQKAQRSYHSIVSNR
jgi:multidrug efflux pump subunit AcrA (membrane-fusion protein)